MRIKGLDALYAEAISLRWMAFILFDPCGRRIAWESSRQVIWRGHHVIWQEDLFVQVDTKLLAGLSIKILSWQRWN